MRTKQSPFKLDPQNKSTEFFLPQRNSTHGSRGVELREKTFQGWCKFH